MSYSKVMKKLRKEMRKDIDAKYKDFRAYLREKSFFARVRILIGMMFSP